MLRRLFLVMMVRETVSLGSGRGIARTIDPTDSSSTVDDWRAGLLVPFQRSDLELRIPRDLVSVDQLHV
jgi:hypothetical protein